MLPVTKLMNKGSHEGICHWLDLMTAEDYIIARKAMMDFLVLKGWHSGDHCYPIAGVDGMSGYKAYMTTLNMWDHADEYCCRRIQCAHYINAQLQAHYDSKRTTHLRKYIAIGVLACLLLLL